MRNWSKRSQNETWWSSSYTESILSSIQYSALSSLETNGMVPKRS